MYHTYHALMLSHQTHVLWLPDRCVPQNALHRLPILSDPDHPLQSPYICAAKLTCQVRIFPVCLMSPAPSWISEYIYIRCPEGKSLVYSVITLFENSLNFPRPSVDTTSPIFSIRSVSKVAARPIA